MEAVSVFVRFTFNNEQYPHIVWTYRWRATWKEVFFVIILVHQTAMLLLLSLSFILATFRDILEVVDVIGCRRRRRRRNSSSSICSSDGMQLLTIGKQACLESFYILWQLDPLQLYTILKGSKPNRANGIG
jgi:hypothetical protein